MYNLITIMIFVVAIFGSVNVVILFLSMLKEFLLFVHSQWWLIYVVLFTISHFLNENKKLLVEDIAIAIDMAKEQRLISTISIF